MDEQEAAERAALERRANKLFSGRVDFLLSAPQLKFLSNHRSEACAILAGARAEI